MKSQTRNGAVLPFIAVVLGMMILLLGLTVELSWLYSTRFEAQSASDLSARSALAVLYSNEDELNQDAIDRAKQIGVDIYGLNFSRSEPITGDDLALGRVNATKEFEEITDASDFRNITASRVGYAQEFTSLLGTMIAKNKIDLGVRSVAEANRLDLILSLDASRSMNRSADRSRGRLPPGASGIHEPPIAGSRWFALAEGVNNFITSISSDRSQLGLTTFGGGLRYRRLVSPLDSTFGRIELELGKMSVNGPETIEIMNDYTDFPALGYGTSIYDGVNDSIDVLLRSTIPSKRFIVLFSDGEQVTFGARPDELQAAHRAAAEGITIFSIAYDVNSYKLEQMATITGGTFFPVSSQEGLDQAFASIATTLKTRITQ